MPSQQLLGSWGMCVFSSKIIPNITERNKLHQSCVTSLHNYGVTVCYYHTTWACRNLELLKWMFPLCVFMCEVLTLALCLQACSLKCSDENKAKQEVLKPARTNIMTDLNSKVSFCKNIFFFFSPQRVCLSNGQTVTIHLVPKSFILLSFSSHSALSLSTPWALTISASLSMHFSLHDSFASLHHSLAASYFILYHTAALTVILDS